MQVLNDLGLGYLTLGQSAATLSGSEAQRIKIAMEMSTLQKSKHTVYILDQPTTGLHLADIERLLASLNTLVDAGQTVILIEHHLDVIKTANHVIDSPRARGTATPRRRLARASAQTAVRARGAGLVGAPARTDERRDAHDANLRVVSVGDARHAKLYRWPPARMSLQVGGQHRPDRAFRPERDCRLRRRRAGQARRHSPARSRERSDSDHFGPRHCAA
jgi:ABC-type sugar transport system ATPase subunit